MLYNCGNHILHYGLNILVLHTIKSPNNTSLSFSFILHQRINVNTIAPRVLSKAIYITLILPERWGCDSHILCSVHCTMTSPTNVDPKCASRSAKLVSTDCMYGCNRGSSQYSQPARCAPQTYRKNGRNETLRPSDMHQSSLVSCKLVCNMDVSRVQCNMLRRAK